MGALPATWNGQVYAIDGYTLAAVGLKPHIRLWGIQAPELRDGAKAESVAGMRARAALEDLLEQSTHKVKCRASKFDRDCHVVAQCSLDDAQAGDIGGALIAAGMAYGFTSTRRWPGNRVPASATPLQRPKPGSNGAAFGRTGWANGDAPCLRPSWP